MICPYCKETIQDGALKCRHCSSMLNAVPPFGQSASYHQNAAPAISADEIHAFAGNNSHYYVRNFAKFTVTGAESFTLTWNWPAFFFTFFWMLYRKMYIQAVITFVLFCLPGLNLLLHIGTGAVGNYLYYKHAKDKIIEIRALQSPQNLGDALQQAGGVHAWVIPVAIVLGIILWVMMACVVAALIGLAQ